MSDISNQGNDKSPKPGEQVILSELPSGFLDNLPVNDQQAISEVVGKPLLLNNYDEDGRAELEFTDRDGIIHFIFVRPELLRSLR